MIADYGFSATLTAKPAMGDQLVNLLLTGLNEDSPGASEHCVVHLVFPSASSPDSVHVTEGWTSEEDHHRIFAGEPTQAIVAQIDGLPAKESEYTDYAPVHGKTTSQPRSQEAAFLALRPGAASSPVEAAAACIRTIRAKGKRASRTPENSLKAAWKL